MIIFMGKPWVVRGLLFLIGLTFVFLGITVHGRGEFGILIGLMFVVLACLPAQVFPIPSGNNRRGKRIAQKTGNRKPRGKK